MFEPESRLAAAVLPDCSIVRDNQTSLLKSVFPGTLAPNILPKQEG